MLHAAYPFVYRRGAHHLVVVNPRREAASIELRNLPGGEALLANGVTLADGRVEADGFSYGIFRLRE